MFEWLVFRTGAFFLMTSTILIGGSCALSSWIDLIMRKWNSDRAEKTPAALYLLLSLVGWDLIAFFYLYSESVMRRTGGQVVVIWIFVLTVGLGLLWVARTSLQRNTEPGAKFLAVGCQILLVISSLCYLVMTVGIVILWNGGRL